MNALTIALKAVERGWHVLPIIDCGRDMRTPVGKRGKRPAPWLAPHGVDDATTDRAVITRWFSDPDLGVGIAAGPSGLAILDVDPRNSGHIELDELTTRYAKLPRTPIVLTGGGGWHFYMRAPEGVRLKNGALRGYRGVEMKTDGGYVVAPPSVHESGRRYVFDLGALPSATPLADLPSWLASLARVADEPTPTLLPARPRTPGEMSAIERASRWLARCEPSIQGSKGSGALMHATSGLTVGFLLSDDVALMLLEQAFNPRAKPSWSRRDLRHAIKSAREKPRKSLGYLLGTPRRVA